MHKGRAMRRSSGWFIGRITSLGWSGPWCGPHSRGGSLTMRVIRTISCLVTASLASGCLSAGYTPGGPDGGAAAPPDSSTSIPAPTPNQSSPFDFAVFQTKIMPALDAAGGKGCSAAACHGAAAGQNGFKLIKGAAADSDD